MRRALLACCLLWSGEAAGHGIGSSQTGHLVEGDPIAVAFSWSSGGPVAYVPFKVYAPGDRGPEFQNGRTDRLGRAVFLPDRAGPWRIEVADEEGHAARVEVDVGPDRAAPAAPVWRHWLLRLSLGANIVLLLAFVDRWRQRRPLAGTA